MSFRDFPTLRYFCCSAGALENFEQILEVADGIMVARGDLGVEIPFENVTIAQKIMIRKCNEVGKPVIVATQMLESMQKAPRPTRAEVSDVTNAVYDGCDAVMLSGESANGQYPVESVQTMRKIIREADLFLQSFAEEKIESTTFFSPKKEVVKDPKLKSSIERQEATCAAAVEAAVKADAKLIIVLVRGGTAARLLAKHRPRQPIMAFCLHPKTARQLNLHRGVFPVVGKGELISIEAQSGLNSGSGSPSVSPYRQFNHRHKNPTEAIAVAKDIGWITTGDKVVIVNGEKGEVNYSTSLGVNVVEIK